MKRILSLVLILILSLSVLTACDVPAQLQDILASLGIGTPSVSYDLDNAKSTLRELYPNLLPTKETPVPSTIANFNVTKVLTCADGKYTVTWSTNVDSIEIVDYVPTKEGDIFSAETTSTVKVKMGSEDVNYVLTATITAPDNTTAVVDFTLVIPKLDCDSHEDYMAAVKDQELMIKGIVVAINSVSLGNKYNHVFLADTDVVGGYYCYKLAADPADLGVKVGMTVTVSGKMSPYSGMQEITGGQLVILDDSIQSVEPVDITDKFAAGADLGAYVALPVTIKGVEIGTQDLVAETSQYLYFSIGEEKGYVRTYVTDFPAGMLTAADKATIDADHAAHFGYKADVTGILILYSGAPYLIPMSVTPFTNYVEVIKTDAEKVASEKETLKVTNSFTADGTMTLPLVGVNYDDVTIAWTSDSEYIVIAEDGTATVTVPDTKTVVKLTATLTCGEATETVEIEVTLNKKALTAGEAAAIGGTFEHNTYTEGKYLIAGIVTEVYNDTYGNMYIKDELGNVLTVYGTYSADGSVRYDAMESKPVAGDYVVLLGVLGQYNGTAQTKNAWIVSWTTPTDIPTANATGTANPNYTADKYLVTGTVTEVANTQYGNLYIEDAQGNKLYLYGLYDQLGNRYDAMTKAPAVGDTITVLTVLGAYKDAPQGKNATLVAHTVAEGGNQGGEDNPPVEDKEVSYIFGMTQGNVNNTIYYLVGGMNGYFMDTTTDASKALHVYLEETDGGYYFYCYVGEVKTYINMVVSGTHVNGAYEAAASTVYRLDAEKMTLISAVDGKDYWFATRNDNTYTTMGPCAVSYNGFYGVLYPVEGGEVTPPEGGEGGETGSKEVTIPEALKAADGTEVVVSGRVIEADEWNTQYNNMSVTIIDEDGNTLYIFRLGTQVTVGDIITVTGKMATFYESRQIGQGATAVVTGHVDPVKPEGNVAASIDFSNVANRTAMSANAQVWESNGLKVSNNKHESTQDVKDYTAPARFYANTNLVIEYTGMTKIVFNLNSGKPASGLTDSIAAADGVTVTVDGYTVTVEFASAVNSFTVAKLVAQIRVNSIEVYN
ncbi:MAG: hypothetical protein IJ360_01905 [Clostridia bacterium]|nr:hypothetical protein [Clostridia bacterium]